MTAIKWAALSFEARASARMPPSNQVAPDNAYGAFECSSTFGSLPNDMLDYEHAKCPQLIEIAQISFYSSPHAVYCDFNQIQLNGSEN